MDDNGKALLGGGGVLAIILTISQIFEHFSGGVVNVSTVLNQAETEPMKVVVVLENETADNTTDTQPVLTETMPVLETVPETEPETIPETEPETIADASVPGGNCTYSAFLEDYIDEGKTYFRQQFVSRNMYW